MQKSDFFGFLLNIGLFWYKKTLKFHTGQNFWDRKKNPKSCEIVLFSLKYTINVSIPGRCPVIFPKKRYKIGVFLLEIHNFWLKKNEILKIGFLAKSALERVFRSKKNHFSKKAPERLFSLWCFFRNSGNSPFLTILGGPGRKTGFRGFSYKVVTSDFLVKFYSTKKVQK